MPALGEGGRAKIIIHMHRSWQGPSLTQDRRIYLRGQGSGRRHRSWAQDGPGQNRCMCIVLSPLLKGLLNLLRHGSQLGRTRGCAEARAWDCWMGSE
eukprot:5653192-Pyramimonas_sp.AAC.1